ncbi:MAG: hypothetical protein A2042_01480 [Candidatus Schekmanbacteria bacterium GWA2_38_11]|uniref:Uncharacterized protein n=1 Tax=Candidatus Schekmanbacteria bacterium GWA2_38_11 TaxID=1817876 RepID=A0A1F7RJW3_9BACT|nr:MAG: hypothetical protein A2042_01480 [Candidatus Schekmanbacteria bacterium GWA2_38_11]
MKRVLFISYYFPPSISAGSFRILRFVKYLPENGWIPYVLTIKTKKYIRNSLDFDILKSFPKEAKIFRTHIFLFSEKYKNLLKFLKSITLNLKGKNEVCQKENKIKVNPNSSKGSYKKIPGELLRTPDIDIGWLPFAFFRGIFLIYKNKIDVIYATGGPFTTPIIGLLLKKFTRLPLVVDFRDPWSDNYIRDFSNPYFKKLAYYFEKKVLKNADKIIANNEALKNNLISLHKEISREKFFVITNGFDEDDFNDLRQVSFEKYSIAYIGSLYDSHSPDSFLKGLKNLVEKVPGIEKNIQVLFVGDEGKKYIEKVKEYSIDKMVYFLGEKPHRDSLEILISSNLLLATLTVPPGATFIPGKIYEYMRSGKPILAITTEGAFKNFLKIEVPNAKILDPQDIDGITDAIHFFYKKYLESAKSSYLSLESSIEKFNVKFLTEKLSKVLAEVN